MESSRRKPKRLLIVLPSWVGDAVMATPSLRVLREYLPGCLLGGLMRPGIDQLLAGTDFFDEIHVDRAAGMMGPKRVASKVRPQRYESAILMTNSFSTALITRLAGIPDRVGYDRDGRGILLTDRLSAPKRREVEPYKRSTTNPTAWAPVPACEYYYSLARHYLGSTGMKPASMGPMELVATREEELAARDILLKAEIDLEAPDTPPLVILNPGGNNPAKRWPIDRFAALADYLAEHHGMHVLLNGAPTEADLIAEIARQTKFTERMIQLPKLGTTIATLKPIVKACRLMVTNDTGPRHIAAAFGTPCVSLFGPTDHRWTTIPHADEIRLLADPDLPEEEVANDHPQRCAIEKIGLGHVVAAANQLLTGAAMR